MPTAKRVLVIDDDRDFTASVQSLLESEGYAVEVAESGKAGLAKLRGGRPDVIVLDVMMESQGEGYAVNQAIRFQPEFETYADIPIIMVSAIEESPDERFARAEDVEQVRPTRYLPKPLNLGRFLEVVGELVGRGSAAEP